MKPCKPTKQQIYDALRVASELALEYVEHEARKILRKCTTLDEFIMCMGAAFFTDKQGNSLHDHEIPKTAFELIVFIEDVDSELHISGNPMRFTADGEKITNW